jgi:hypothetical protein
MKCIDCAHAREKPQPTILICKKNCVYHSPHDECMKKEWFEEKPSTHDNQKELIKSMEMLERMTIKGDTNTWLHVSRVADLARGGYFHMGVKK